MQTLSVIALILLVAQGASAQAGSPVFHRDQAGWSFDTFNVIDAEGLPALQLVAQPPTGPQRKFVLQSRLQSVKQVVIGEASTLLAIGQSSVADAVSVLSMDDGSVKDEFLVYSATPSPSGRFLAFTKFFPRNASMEDLCLVYDLRLSATTNRMEMSTSEKVRTNVGWAVYPESNRRIRSPPRSQAGARSV